MVTACESTIHDPEPVEVPAHDRTASFNGVRVELTKVNYSWMPPAGPVPVHGERLVTLQIAVESFARDPKTIQPSEFRLRTWDGTRRYQPSNTTTWMAQAGGRQPALERRDIETGEGLRQWLTVRLPQGISYLPDALLWEPDPGISNSFSLPTHSGSLVCGVGRIFGRVTDSSGVPVGAAPVELAFFNLAIAGNSFEGGRCRGRLSSSSEVTTNQEGRYEDEVVSRFCDEFCVRLTAFASNGSEASTVQVHGGTIVPSPPHPLVEPSELRIDAVLPDVEPD